MSQDNTKEISTGPPQHLRDYRNTSQKTNKLTEYTINQNAYTNQPTNQPDRRQCRVIENRLKILKGSYQHELLNVIDYSDALFHQRHLN